MLSIEHALQEMLEKIEPLPDKELVELGQASNRVVRDSLIAPISLPPFEASAMDGYAVRSEDCQQSKTSLTLFGTSFAGTPFVEIVPRGGAVRIFTGAALPDTCDAVVLQEDVELVKEHIVLHNKISKGENVRHRGTDIEKGGNLLETGKKLSAYDIAWLAACGVGSVSVTRPIRVALFSTGDELRDPGQTLEYGQIYDSNRESLKAFLEGQPVTVRDLGRLPDNFDQIQKALQSVAESTDLIITSGGVSVGDADFVRPVIQSLGELTFWNVALKPGKPIAFGKVGDAWFFGLPGNPVSAVITYLLFVLPAIDKLSGARVAEPETLPAVLSHELKHTKGRREYQRGRVRRAANQLLVNQTGDQSSNRLSSLASANCLIVVPEECGSLSAGAQVDILLLPRVANQLAGSF